MSLAKRVSNRAAAGDFVSAFGKTRFAPLEDIIVSGGDHRLALSGTARQNSYGCTPYPWTGLNDFASSTASCISEEAYGRVAQARERFLAKAIGEGAEQALQSCVAEARLELLSHLRLENSQAGIVFAASGTDAQLQALFLAKSLLGSPLTTIIVGADQTGSGTHYTSRGLHFSHVTAGGCDVEKGTPVSGLADRVRTIAIPFARPDGEFRTLAEMDRMVENAVARTIAGGGRVLLQTMDASKFGWRAPSDACVKEIAGRWPGRVQVVIDACQMRLSQKRLHGFLADDFMVLITGSKFFTGPAFSGALIVPGALSAKIAETDIAPAGLSAYASADDWPEGWTNIRKRFAVKPNLGQWLRWEAALEEMRLYYSVPTGFREDVQAFLAGDIVRLVEASPCLRLLSYGPNPDEALKGATMFPVLPHRGGTPLSAVQCATLYKALRRDLSAIAGKDSEYDARMPCQVGQPVALLGQDSAALRISLSARTIRQCWAAERNAAKANTDRALGRIGTLIGKMQLAIRNIEDLEFVSRMTPAETVFSESWVSLCVPRLGLAHLTWQAFQGIDLGPLWDELMDAASDDVAGSGMGMDLAVIAQLRGDKQTGLAIQRDTLLLQQLFRADRALEASRLRVLAIAAASDIGANTPIEFLLEGADIDLATYYVVPGIPLPNPMPSHDVAIVVASAECEDALALADAISESWPCPILNPPAGIRNLERDRLYRQLHGIAGLDIPATARVARAELEAAGDPAGLRRLLADGAFPIIVRPLGSHAGFGLARIDDESALRDYLRQRPESEFFISRYIDYASADGLFRKYRVVVIGGKPYACHMAIAEEWKVWYLNADMALSVANRVEEAAFMQFFDDAFGARHGEAIAAMADRIGLEYFIVDCAETHDGELLIFEADNSAIVHDMDPPSVYPYKSVQMRKIFGAFAEMLRSRAVMAKTCAA